jgi:peptidoglycan/LPS O-acetylase OafA/YrhL
MIVVVIPLSSLFSTFDARNQGYETAKSASLFFANIELMLFRPNGYFTATEQTNPFLHTWSLSLEEQIYFVVPVMLFGLWWLSRRASTRRPSALFVVGILVVSLISFWISYVLTVPRDLWPVNLAFNPLESSEASRMYAFYSPITRVWEFLAGSLMAVIPSPTRRVTRSVAFVAGLAGIAYAGFTFGAQSVFPGVLATIPVGATMLLILSGGTLGPIAPLTHRVFTWLGDRSYSWYLWHWPLIQFTKATFPDFTNGPVVAALVGLAVAAVSYRFIEEPIRHGAFWGRHRSTTLGLVAVCIAVPIALTTALRHEPTPELDVHIDVTSGCVEASWETLRADDQCIWKIPGAIGDAVLIGDSQAGHLSEGFIEAAHANRLNARIVTRTGPFFLYHEDRNYAARVIAENPDTRVVVLGQSTPFGDTVEWWKNEAAGYLIRLNEADIPVIFSHTIRKGGNPLRCATIRFDRLANTCEIDPVESANSGQEMPTLHSHERDMLALAPGNFAFDSNRVLCPREPCVSYQQGEWLWRDPSHISIAGAQRIAPKLSDVIAEAIDR